MKPNSEPFRVAALYRFCRIERHEEMRAPLLELCRAQGVKGTLLLAQEGINGTVAGSESAIDALLAFLERRLGLSGLEIKYSAASEMPFHRMKVRLKQEIVTMGVDDLDAADAGAYVEPRESSLRSFQDVLWSLLNTREFVLNH